MGELDGRARLALCVLLAALCACGGGEPPRRVISLSESTTRVAQALGLGDRLQSLDPRAPDVLEKAFKSGANLALADDGAASADVRAAFASRSIAVRVFSPTSTDEVLAAYTEIATVLGQPKAAGELIARVTRELGTGAAPRTKVALVVSRSPLRVVVGDAFVSRLLDAAGLENVFGAEQGVTVVLRPEQLEAKHAERVIDVPQSALDSAWVTPVDTARSFAHLATGG